MSVVLTAINNVAAVSSGLYSPHFTTRIKDLNTRSKTLNLESAQFELHFENVASTSNKLYVKIDGHVDQIDILTGTYTDIDDLVAIINESLKNASHSDIKFFYSRRSSRVRVSVPDGKTVMLRTDSPGVLLGVGEIATSYDIIGSHTLPYAVDLSRGRRFVLLYTDLIHPSIEYEDNTDSRVLKTFLVQSLNGVNNYVFSKDDARIMVPHENVTEITFWMKFNTGELITSGYPIYLDLRIKEISPP